MDKFMDLISIFDTYTFYKHRLNSNAYIAQTINSQIDLKLKNRLRFVMPSRILEYLKIVIIRLIFITDN